MGFVPFPEPRVLAAFRHRPRRRQRPAGAGWRGGESLRRTRHPLGRGSGGFDAGISRHRIWLDRRCRVAGQRLAPRTRRRGYPRRPRRGVATVAPAQAHRQGEPAGGADFRGPRQRPGAHRALRFTDATGPRGGRGTRAAQDFRGLERRGSRRHQARGDRRRPLPPGRQQTVLFGHGARHAADCHREAPRRRLADVRGADGPRLLPGSTTAGGSRSAWNRRSARRWISPGSNSGRKT